MEDKYKPIYFFNDTNENNRKLFSEKGTQLLQMAIAISAIFKSLMDEKAVKYRQQFGITKEIADGTAIIVSSMVIDNMKKIN